MKKLNTEMEKMRIILSNLAEKNGIETETSEN